MSTKAVLKQKLLRKNLEFSYKSDEQESDVLKKEEISFFNVLVDVSIVSLKLPTVSL